MKKIIVWSLIASLAGFLFGFDTVVISGADKKLQELKDEQYKLNLELEEHTKADHEYHIQLSTVLNLSRRVKSIFDGSEVNEKRALIRFLLQNPVVEEKKLVFELRKPFDTVLQLAMNPTVLRGWDSNPRQLG